MIHLLPMTVFIASVGVSTLALLLALPLMSVLAVVLLRPKASETRALRLRRWLPWAALLGVAPAVLVLSAMISGDVRWVFVSEISWRLVLANSAHAIVVSFAQLIAHLVCRLLRVDLPDGFYWGWLVAGCFVYLHLFLLLTHVTAPPWQGPG